MRSIAAIASLQLGCGLYDQFHPYPQAGISRGAKQAETSAQIDDASPPISPVDR